FCSSVSACRSPLPFPTRRSSDLMAFSMAACGGSSGSTATSGATSTDSTAADGSATAATGVTVQVGPNPETLDPALNSAIDGANRSEEHTSELQSRFDLVCRLLLE